MLSRVNVLRAVVSVAVMVLPLFADINTGLVAYYPFSGNANDLSGNGNNGTVHNATLTANRAGLPNSAYSFNGASSYINVPNNPALNGSSGITVAAWIKVNSLVQAQDIVSKWTAGVSPDCAYKFSLNSGKVRVELTNSGGLTMADITSRSSLPVGTWVFVAFTYDGTVQVYLNGSSVAKETVDGGAIRNSAAPLNIGAETNGTAAFFNGCIDEVRVYSRALSDEDIQELFGTNLNDGLAAYYPFSGNASDASGNGNNGTVHNVTLTTDRTGTANAAYSFNGTTSYIEVPASASLDLEAGISVAAWVYTNATWGDRDIASKWDDGTGAYSWVFGHNGPRNLEGIVRASPYNTAFDLISNGTIANGTWVHVVFAADQSTVKMYRNGTLDVTIWPAGWTMATTGTNLILGARNGGSYGNFSGKLDEIRIYNRALSAAEALALYQLGSGSTHTIKLVNKDWLCIDRFEWYNGSVWTPVEANDPTITYVGDNWSDGTCPISKNGWADESEPSYVEYTFAGTGIRVYTGEQQYQRADVFIDGVFRQTIVPSEDGCMNKAFQKTGLR